ncbi:hypothetical protein HYPGJ_31584 [Hyphomicrobium sp. GJ21]|nr:hypothetical protein HYPGJ_31584 [Hyphomicrobium sp. GJ21]
MCREPWVGPSLGCPGARARKPLPVTLAGLPSASLAIDACWISAGLDRFDGQDSFLDIIARGLQALQGRRLVLAILRVGEFPHQEGEERVAAVFERCGPVPVMGQMGAVAARKAGADRALPGIHHHHRRCGGRWRRREGLIQQIDDVSGEKVMGVVVAGEVMRAHELDPVFVADAGDVAVVRVIDGDDLQFGSFQHRDHLFGLAVEAAVKAGVVKGFLPGPGFLFAAEGAVANRHRVGFRWVSRW